jgi:hypothetical protein
MKLKKTIQLIEYSNALLIAILLIGVVVLMSKSGEGKWLVLEALIFVPFILAFIFRKIIVAVYLKKTAYPGVFYSVLEKLGLSQNLELSLTDELLSEIYNPAYSTSQFLNDNNLKTDIGKKKVQLPLLPIITVAGLAGLFFLAQRIAVQRKPFVFIMGAIFIAANIYTWVKEKKQQNDNEPIVQFKKTGLELPAQKIDWQSIYDWQDHASDKNEARGILINYYDEEKNIREAAVDLSAIDIGKIDFLMLMTHFKGKYGQVKTEKIN